MEAKAHSGPTTPKRPDHAGDKVPPRIASGLGGELRVDPVPAEVLDQRVLDLVEEIRIMTGYPEHAPIHPFFRIIGRSPDFMLGFTGLGMNTLPTSQFGVRDRELIILRTGWLCDAPYQWGEHVASGRRAGLSDEEIERIKAGPSAQGWPERDRALLMGVDELHFDKTISDETWDLMSRHFEDRHFIELPIIVGHYHMTALLQNSLRCPPNRNAEGILLKGEEWA